MTPELQELIDSRNWIQDEIPKQHTFLRSVEGHVSPETIAVYQTRIKVFEQLAHDLSKYLETADEGYQAEEGDTGDPGDTGFYGEGPDVEEEFYSDIQSPDTGDTGYSDNYRLVAAREAMANQEKQREASPSGVIAGPPPPEPEYGKYRPGPQTETGQMAGPTKAEQKTKLTKQITEHDKARQVEQGLRRIGME
tara:strand:- start:2344 stop:2925 length:582 start_codon:yes stop_codon:yes gene_type:complete